MKTAINAVAPIEPFKLFYKIDRGVNLWANNSTKREQRFKSDGCRNQRDAGLSQLGFACFWPKAI